MGHPVYGSAAWQWARAATLERDGYRCQIGLPGCAGVATAADHVIELDDGGAPFDLENLQAACTPCNSAKANMRRGAARRSRERLRRW